MCTSHPDGLVYSPLSLAVSQHFFGITELLLAHGTDPTATPPTPKIIRRLGHTRSWEIWEHVVQTDALKQSFAGPRPYDISGLCVLIPVHITPSQETDVCNLLTIILARTTRLTSRQRIMILNAFARGGFDA